MTTQLPSRARVVVIGGGVIGPSVAYHLGHLGWTDTVLVERDQLTSGTTWHAAGLMVTFGSTSGTSTELRQYTADLYSRLEAETGLATGFKPVGFIELAADEGRLEEYRRVAAFNRHCGVDVHEISPREVADRFPLARTDDILAGFQEYTPTPVWKVEVPSLEAFRALKSKVAKHEVYEADLPPFLRIFHAHNLGPGSPFSFRGTPLEVQLPVPWTMRAFSSRVSSFSEPNQLKLLSLALPSFLGGIKTSLTT